MRIGDLVGTEGVYKGYIHRVVIIVIGIYDSDTSCSTTGYNRHDTSLVLLLCLHD